MKIARAFGPGFEDPNSGAVRPAGGEGTRSTSSGVRQARTKATRAKRGRGPRRAPIRWTADDYDALLIRRASRRITCGARAMVRF